MTDKEQWKPIPQYEELYEVSDKNCNYGQHCQRIKDRLNRKHHLAKPVARLDRDGDVIEIYKSASEAARQMGVRSENISRCCNGKNSLSCGYGWKYVDNDG